MTLGIFLCRLLCLSIEECQVVGIISLQPFRSTSFTQSFASTCPPYCLMAHSSTGQHSTCPGVPQLLHSPKEEYLFASKFGQLWIKLLSTLMCSFLGGHTFSTDLGRGQEVCNGWIYKSMFPFASTCHVILQGARPHCASYCGTEALPLSHCSPTSPTFGTVCVLGHSNKCVSHLALICNSLVIYKVEHFPHV